MTPLHWTVEANRRAGERFMARDLDGAIGILEEATTGLGPEHQEHARFLYENLGLIYLQTHLVRHAALCFLRALDGDPTSREQSLRLLIVAYARLGQRWEALECLRTFEARFGPHPDGVRADQL